MTDGGFGPQHLPFGVTPEGCVTRIGDSVLRLDALERTGLLDAGGCFVGTRTLNRFMAAGRPLWTAVRRRLQDLVMGDRDQLASYLAPVDEGRMLLPFEVADYVDFYSSKEHATNLGRMFRPDAPPLLPNWTHLPIGYHGRAGTLVVSGTPIPRPCGQRKPPDAPEPVFGPSTRLDIEAEVGFVVGVPSSGRLSTEDFAEHVFGVVLVNDWSARDIQAWEYQPLGPFLGKSFATSVSPWVTPLDALASARVPAPVQDPPVLPYLRETERFGYDIRLEVVWNRTLVTRPPFAGMYWTPAQQLAHLTANGAWVRTGDVYASGTVSGPGRDQSGSFIELSWNGTHPVRLDDGTERTFLADGDIVTIRAQAPGADGDVIDLGPVSGQVTPAVP